MINLKNILSSTKTTLLISFLLATFLLSATTTFAKYYDERPHISEVKAKDHSKSSKFPIGWKKASYGHFAFMAQMLTFFPDSEYYFLARDIEYLYDMSQVLLKDSPNVLKRTHLVPVSTVLSNYEEEMVKYLQQEGVTAKNLGQRSAVFIDSCCSGSIPKKVAESFGESLSIKGFLIQADSFPSSLLADVLGANGGDIESLPHYTESATHYVGKKNSIRIYADLADESERTDSRMIMEQIRYDFDNDKARKDFKELVGLMKDTYSFLVKNSPYKKASKEKAIRALKIMSTKFGIPPSAFIQDIKTMKRKNYAAIENDNFKALNEIAKTYDVDAIAKLTLKNPDSLDIFSSSELFKKVDLNLVVEKALNQLLNSNASDLNLSESQLITLVSEWIEVLKIGSGTIITPNLTSLLFRIQTKFFGSLEATKGLVEVFSNEILDSPKLELAAIDLLKQAITQEKYQYSSTTSLGYLIEQISFIKSYPNVFKGVMSHVVEKANPQVVSKVVDYLILNAYSFLSHKYYYKTEKNDSFYFDVLKKSIDRLPTISHSLMKKILESDMLYSNQDELKAFGKWLFSQSEYFESKAYSLPLSGHVADVFKNGKLEEGSKELKVSDLVNYYSQSTGKGSSCSIRFGKK